MLEEKYMKSNILDKSNKMHFVGIGGSGMCPMAEILHKKGYTLTGSDLNETETVRRIRDLGIPVTVGPHKAENIGDADVVVYTAAAKEDNPELVAAREKGLPTLERAIMLGHVTREFGVPVGVSGTHGKTSTTAMLTNILIDDGIDPSAVIGGKLPLIGGNGRIGESEVIVVEACEYVDTFLSLYPAVSVILNIDEDHMDYFKTLDRLIESFHKYATQTSQSIIVNGDDDYAMRAVSGDDVKAEIITFGLTDKSDYYATDLKLEPTACEDFTLMHNGEALGKIELKVPGEHNLENALAAAATAHVLGANPETICKSLSNFSGVQRRFQIRGEFDGITIADDFAHHPTELTAVLTSAMNMGFNEVWAVFQPHTYTRTYNHMDDFAKALAIPSHVVMSEILAVRETNESGVKTADLAEKIDGSVWFDTFEEITDYVMERAKSGDLILTLGGGNVYLCADMFVDKYGKKD